MALESKNLRIITERIEKGSDLKTKIREIAEKHQITAGYILSIVGSFQKSKLRFPSANTKKYRAYCSKTGDKLTNVLVYDYFEEEGIYEICGGTGTISQENIHIHLTLNDLSGNCIGGHLLRGCTVFSTVELAILCSDNIRMYKKYDENTGHKELQLEKIEK